MPADTKYVFVDTQVFDAHNQNYLSPNFQRLVLLAGADELHLVLTTVTTREIRKHLVKHARDISKQLRNYERVHRVVKTLIPQETIKTLEDIDEDKIQAELQFGFTRFMIESKAIELKVDSLCVEDIFYAYFAEQPPFSEQGKKSEFPDAFAATALAVWSEAEDPSRKIYIVSDDGDWRRICLDKENFIHVRTLPALLEMFSDEEVVANIKTALYARSEELKKHIAEQFISQEIYVFIEEGPPEAQIIEIEDAEVELHDIFVVESKNGSAAVNIYAEPKLSLNIQANDPDSGIYDHEKGDMHYVSTMSGTIEHSIDVMAITLLIDYNEQNPKEITIEKWLFPEKEYGIYIDETGLSRDDENETIEYDPD